MHIRQEIRYAVRSLLRSRLATYSIIATLAVCIGAVAAVYSVVDVVLVRGLPFDRPEELVWVSSVSPDRPDRPFSLPEFMDYRAQATSVRVAGYSSWSGILETASGAERLQGLRMSADGLSILGASPTLGRLLTSDDDLLGAPRVLMLGYAYWRRQFAGDATVVGRTMTISGQRFTIVGVLPRFFPVPVRDVDAVVPFDPESDPRRHARGSVNFIRIIARLEPRMTPTSAARELNAIAARLREQFPREYGSKIGVRVIPLQDQLATTQRATLVVLLACVSLMVAVALANVLTLLLARAVGRQGETAVRVALGASSLRIAVQVLVEGVLLVTVAGIIGVAFAQTAISYAVSHLAVIVPRVEEARLSWSVLGVVFGICALAVLLFSFIPILVARGVAPALVLRSAGRSGSQSRSQARLRSSFVIAELALAVVITSATAALAQSLIALERVELGYRPDSVFVARLSLPATRYKATADIARFTTTMSAALGAAPGVAAAGAVSIAPLTGLLSAVPFAPAEQVPAARRDWPVANFRAVSAGYFSAVGARVIAGTSIAEHDDSDRPAVAVVNRRLAERYFARGGALGRELLVDDNNRGPRALTIVGVVDDLRDVDLDGGSIPEIFISLEQVHPDGISFVTATQFWAVRTRNDATAFGPTFLRILRDVDPSVATAGMSDLRAYVAAAIAPRRFSVSILAVFTGIAVLLTAFGVYGVTAYGVEQRRAEIGIRMALGATPRGVVSLVLGRTLRLACLGVVLGLAGALTTGGLMSRLMFGVPVNRPAVLVSVAACVLVVALVAAALPGRRAAHIDPLRALSAQ